MCVLRLSVCVVSLRSIAAPVIQSPLHETHWGYIFARKKEAQTSPKQWQICSLFLLLFLWLGAAASFWVCGSVYMNNIVLYHTILSEFFNYRETNSSCPAPCCIPNATSGCNGWRCVEHTRNTVVTERTCIQCDPRVKLTSLAEPLC